MNSRGLCTELLIPIGSLIGLLGLLVVGAQCLWFLRSAAWPGWSLLDPIAWAAPTLAAGFARDLPGLAWGLETAPLGCGLVAICVACWLPALLHGPP